MKNLFLILALVLSAASVMLPDESQAAEKKAVLCEQGAAKTDALGRIQQPMGCKPYVPPKEKVEKPPFYGMCLTEYRYGKDTDRTMFNTYHSAGLECAAGFRLGSRFFIVPGVNLNYAPRMGEFSSYRVFDTQDDAVRGYNLYERQTIFTPTLSAELTGESWTVGAGVGLGLDTNDSFGYDNLYLNWYGELLPKEWIRLGLNGRYHTLTSQVDVYAHRAKILFGLTPALWLGSALDSQAYNEVVDHIETTHSFGGALLGEWEVVKYLRLKGELATSQASRVSTSVGIEFTLGK